MPLFPEMSRFSPLKVDKDLHRQLPMVAARRQDRYEEFP